MTGDRINLLMKGPRLRTVGLSKGRMLLLVRWSPVSALGDLTHQNACARRDAGCPIPRVTRHG
jgi:hypothetical protein